LSWTLKSWFLVKMKLYHVGRLFTSLEAVPRDWRTVSSSHQEATQFWRLVMGGDWRNGLKQWHHFPWSSCGAIFYTRNF
jgi:hypothetical protein